MMPRGRERDVLRNGAHHTIGPERAPLRLADAGAEPAAGGEVLRRERLEPRWPANWLV